MTGRTTLKFMPKVPTNPPTARTSSTIGVRPDVAKTVAQIRAHRSQVPRHLQPRRRHQFALAHGKQANHDRPIAEPVENEAKRRAEEADQDPGNGRPDDARAVEDGRIEGDRVGDVVAADHLHHERLASGHVHRVDQAQKEREDEDVPDHDDVEVSEQAQGERQQAQRDLGSDHGPSFGPDVGDDPSEEAQKQDRQELHHAQQADVQDRLIPADQSADEPALGHGLHPRPRDGDELAEEEEAVVAVLKGPVRQPST